MSLSIRSCSSTNASGLDRPEVGTGLNLLTPRDEVWAKLDAGTPDYIQRVNRPDCSMEKVLGNILRLARKRPVIIQSLFPSMKGESPPAPEIDAYVQRLRDFKEAGAQIPLVQIYSATRPTAQSECSHLPLRTLYSIASACAKPQDWRRRSSEFVEPQHPPF